MSWCGVLWGYLEVVGAGRVDELHEMLRRAPVGVAQRTPHAAVLILRRTTRELFLNKTYKYIYKTLKKKTLKDYSYKSNHYWLKSALQFSKLM